MNRVSLEASVGWEMDDPIPEGFAAEPETKFAPGSLFTYVNTQDVVNYLNSAKSSITAIDRDVVNNSAVLEVGFVNQWVAFAQEFQKFYDANIDSGHFWDAASVMDQTDVYLKRAADFQKQASDKGGSNYKATAPALDLGSQETVQSLVKTIAIGAGVILGGLAVLKGLDYIPKPAKELRRKSEEEEDESE